MSLYGLCKRNAGNSQRKRRRRKNAPNVLNYSFAPDETFRFILSMHKSIRKILLDLNAQELLGCFASHLPRIYQTFL